jgi:iduronate 2-sulfatase
LERIGKKSYNMKESQSRINRRDFMKGILYRSIGSAAALAGLFFLPGGKTHRNNVLFIMVDDLRPQLGCYGETQMVTPYIDRLAAQGMVFERSYCQQAICAPSRTSLLSGLRPGTTGIYDLKTRLSDILPAHPTLPQYFKQNGYETISLGNVFHHLNDSLNAWSQEPLRVKIPEYATEDGLKLARENQKLNPGLAWLIGAPTEIADVPDNAYKDGQVTGYALKELERVKGKPFFLCVGYKKPHLPFAAPKKYWDLYDPGKIKLAPNPFPPRGMTPYTMNVYGELRNFYGIPKGNDPVPDEQARHLIHGYYACVSFVDAQVGHLMEGLAMFKLRGKTIVILWGDNGLKLGEHGSWSKHTNFEIDTRVPLIVSVPGMKVAGKYTKALVESVDVYPTLCELCGLDLPKQPLEGISFAPILAEPGLKWKKAAFSLNPRGAGIIGIAMRTGRFRYIEWKNQKAGKVLARELYDHDIDPLENVNVSADPSYGGAIKEIEQMMKRGWEGALP